MWRSRNDFGLEQVANVHDSLKIDDYWAIDLARGFMWWPEEFAQTISSDIGMFHNAQSIFRLHIETELLRGRGHAENFELALATEMKHASLSGICFEPEKDLYVFHSSVYASQDNWDWMSRLFLATVALQAAEAHHIGHDLARALNAVPAISAHPHHDIRSRPDPVLQAVDQFFKPYGSQPSKWEGVPEWQQTKWAIDRESSHFDSDMATYIEAQFPYSYGASPIEMSVTTKEPHPILGNGLALEIRVPIGLSPERCAHIAMALNNIERTEWLRCQMLGSWGVGDGMLEYETFIPNVSYHPELLENMTLTMAIRAQWVNELFSTKGVPG